MVKSDEPIKPSTEPRRAFIRERLESRGKVTFREIYEAFPGTDRASIHQDAKALEKTNIKVEIEGLKNDRFLSSVTYVHVQAKPRRKKLNQEGKGAIARVMAGIVAGSELEEWWPMEGGYEESWPVKDEILEHLEKIVGPLWSTKSIVDRLKRFWDAQQRTICLDAGTTTEAVASQLQQLTFPRPNLTHLYLCTNSRGIFEMTGKPTCEIRTIVIGGTQQARTEAICGELALKCLGAWDPFFGISIIGTTVIDARFKLGCFSYEEGALKASLLERGSLRVIVCDHTKFQAYPMGAAAPFAMLASPMVDLIVTDRRPDIPEEKLKECLVPILFAEGLVKSPRRKSG